jgi:hypothetical protein
LRVDPQSTVEVRRCCDVLVWTCLWSVAEWSHTAEKTRTHGSQLLALGNLLLKVYLLLFGVQRRLFILDIGQRSSECL